MKGYFDRCIDKIKKYCHPFAGLTRCGWCADCKVKDECWEFMGSLNNLVDTINKLER
jgi:hypothetical protein